MRRIVILLILFGHSIFAQGEKEKFYVIQVFGEVYKSADSTLIKSGDVFYGNDILFCSSKNDSALLYSLERNYVYFPNDKPTEKTNEFSYFIYNNTIPKKQYIGTRGDYEQLKYLVLDQGELVNPKTVFLGSKRDTVSNYYLEIKTLDNKVQKRIHRATNNNKFNIDKKVLNDISSELDIETIRLVFKSYNFDINTSKKVTNSSEYAIKTLKDVQDEIKALRLVWAELQEKNIELKIKDYVISNYDDDVWSKLKNN